jgi:large conductance mechanosensitive channel
MAVINFLIVAWVVFLLVKGVNRLKRMAETEVKKTEATPAGPSEKELLTEIRDALVAQGARQG